jgi:hypothetical protein
MKQNVNYIIHHKNVNEKMIELDFNATHISLYNALFLLWNNCGFDENLSINRNDVMSLSKIGSVNTYLKCLKDLDNHKIISYKPSHNPLKGSIINLFRFDTSDDIVLNKYNTTTDTSSDTSTDTLYKLLNNKTIKLIEKNINLINSKKFEDFIKFEKEEKESKEIKKIDFSVFWDLYDRKKGSKHKCEDMWNDLNFETQTKIIEFIPKFLKTISEKKYQVYPERFLKYERWNDEIEPTIEYNKGELVMIEKALAKKEQGWSRQDIIETYKYDIETNEFTEKLNVW